MSKHSRLFVPVPLRRLACVLILLMAVAACFPSGQAILAQLEKAAGLTDFQEVALEWPMSLPCFVRRKSGCHAGNGGE